MPTTVVRKVESRTGVIPRWLEPPTSALPSSTRGPEWPPATCLSLGTSVSHPQHVRNASPVRARTLLNAGHESPKVVIASHMGIPSIYLNHQEADLPVSHPAAAAVLHAHTSVDSVATATSALRRSLNHAPAFSRPTCRCERPNPAEPRVSRSPPCYATRHSARVCTGLVVVQNPAAPPPRTHLHSLLPTSYIHPKAAQPAPTQALCATSGNNQQERRCW
ncbi:hypothetical protein MVEN_02560900 [Mycena venus]|uniref:Uncharacterized protein n=1 Tax=Mycena venus TaxID=2733690 RepID=A0A8H6U3K5_9AGAR|nr:hypothetical protein MVEN_02560900 [Mycena venus]